MMFTNYDAVKSLTPAMFAKFLNRLIDMCSDGGCCDACWLQDHCAKENGVQEWLCQPFDFTSTIHII